MSDPSTPVARTLRSHPRALLASPTLEQNIFSSSPAADSPMEAAEPPSRRRITRPHPRVLSAPSTLDPSIPPCSSAEDSLMGVFAPHPISQPSLSGDSQRIVTGRFARISLAFTRPHSTTIGSLQAPPCTTSLSVSGPHAPVAAFTMQSAIDVRLHCNQQSVRLTGTKRKSQHIGPPSALEQTHNAGVCSASLPEGAASHARAQATRRTSSLSLSLSLTRRA